MYIWDDLLFNVVVERVADGYILFEVRLEITWLLWVMHLKKLVVWTLCILTVTHSRTKKM